MTKLAEVHTIYEANCRSIPAMLRQAADSLENDPDCTATAMVAVQLDEGGNVLVYGWGETGLIHAAGLLHLGLQKVVDMKLEEG
jgi:threonine dehydrogenase-like Zn-dependent dehydrogenase